MPTLTEAVRQRRFLGRVARPYTSIRFRFVLLTYTVKVFKKRESVCVVCGAWALKP